MKKIREWLRMALLFLAFINLEVAMWLDPTGELDKVWEEREMDDLLRHAHPSSSSPGSSPRSWPSAGTPRSGLASVPSPSVSS